MSTFNKNNFLAQYGTTKHIDAALSSGTRAAKISALGNPLATSEHITKGLADDDNNIKEAAIGNPNVTSEHLNKIPITASTPGSITNRIAKSPKLSDEQASHLLAVHNPEDYDHRETIKHVLGNPAVGSHVLTPYLHHSNSELAQVAYGNPTIDKREGLKSPHASIVARAVRDVGTKEDLDQYVNHDSPYVKGAVLGNKNATKSHLDTAVQHYNNDSSEGKEEYNPLRLSLFHASAKLNHYPAITGVKPIIDRISNEDIAKIPEPKLKKLSTHYNIKPEFRESDAIDVLTSNPTHINLVASGKQRTFDRLHAGHTVLMSSPHLNQESLLNMGTAKTDRSSEHIPIMALQHKNITKEIGQKIVDAHPENPYISQMKSIVAKMKK